MTLVLDASAAIAALLDTGPDGAWVESTLRSAPPLVAPHVMPAEVANMLRRAVSARDVSATAASLALQKLLKLPLELFGFETFAERVWELRPSITAYDAWYVALAESLGAKLVTLDAKLARAHGPRCRFAMPPRGLA